jgi:C1A family cysteine protease
MMKHKTGWIPDFPDHRDVLYSAPAVALPDLVDLRSYCTAVEDQGQLGSCTANAIVGALEFLEKKAGTRAYNLSRLFLYYNERVLENSVGSDSGAMLRDGVKALVKWGCCHETIWPYAISAFAARPTEKCFVAASTHVISSYQRLVSVNDMLQCLASGFPFVFGFSVYESFESMEAAKTGIINMPEPGESLLGGHAVLCVGYDTAAARFTCRNSWGTKWGGPMVGYFTIPFGYLGSRDLSDDFWTIRK